MRKRRVVCAYVLIFLLAKNPDLGPEQTAPSKLLAEISGIYIAMKWILVIFCEARDLGQECSDNN